MRNTYLYFIGMLLSAGLAFSACQTEEEVFSDVNEPLVGAKTYKVSIPAVFGDADTRAMTITDDYISAYFDEGEKVFAYKKAANASNDNISGELTAKSSGESTTFSGTFTGSFEVGDQLLLSYQSYSYFKWVGNIFPGYGGQDGSKDNLKDFDFAFAWVTVESVNGDEITTSSAEFENVQSIFKLNFVDEGGNAVNLKRLIFKGASVISGFTPLRPDWPASKSEISVYLEEPNSEVWVAIGIDEEVNDGVINFNFAEDEDGWIYTGEKQISGSLKNGRFYSSTITLEKTGERNTLTISPESNYTYVKGCYQVSGSVTISGVDYNESIQLIGSGYELTLDNLTLNGGSLDVTATDNKIVLKGTNEMKSLGFHPHHGCATFKGTGNLTITNGYFNPEEINIFYYEDGLVALYDADSQIATIFKPEATDIINFADSNVRALCVNAGWDTSGDGQISYAEAAAVTDLGTVFKNSSIQSFVELRFFYGLTTISVSAFEGCSALTKISLPASITLIGDKAFYGNSSLILFNPPLDLTKIGSYAFAGCTALKGSTDIYSFYITENVTQIEEKAFQGCSVLAGLEVQSTNLVIGTSAFQGCYLRNNGVSFSYAESITFGDGAFSGTSMYYISMMGTPTFGADVFFNCANLSSITMSGATTPPAFGEDMLYGCTNLSNIYVPSASVDDYKAADGWSEYADMIKGR